MSKTASVPPPPMALDALALEAFSRSVRSSYGERLVSMVVFGSRARGDARQESDLDVAVVLDRIEDPACERDRLSDLAYDAIVETAIEVQAWPVSAEEWENPKRHHNPALIEAMKRDGKLVSVAS